jgi:hypothetical protein
MILAALSLFLTQSVVAERAYDWDTVFNRNSGWTGADGIYSIPLNEKERPDGWKHSATAFVFSDTFWGDVDASGVRQAGTVMVNNTLGFLSAGAGAQSSQAVFLKGGNAGNPEAVFVPETPNSEADSFYWLKDGIRIGNRTHIFAARMRKTPAPFHRYGITLLTISEDDSPPFQNVIQRETPFWQEALSGQGQIAFGGAILNNTVEAGSPAADGFIYIYGIQEDWLNKKAIVARVLRAEFEDFTAWRFWDGSGWSDDMLEAAVVAERISTEMSVTPIRHDLFLMVFMLDTISGKIAIRRAPTPVGPWSNFEVVYEAPRRTNPPVYYYHAKAHPHLSEPGSLLVSFNVNTTNFWDHFAWADIYRPRFLRLRVE